MFRSTVTVLACAVLWACGDGARAQLIVSDGFNDATGAITNAGGGTGWPADGNHNWFTGGGNSANQVTPGGLTFSAAGSALAASGGKLTTVGSDVGAFRNLPTASGNYGGNNNRTLWISFLAANGSATNQAGYAGLSLLNAYTSGGVYTQTENFFIGQVNGKGQYGFLNEAASNSNGAAFLTGVATDTATHLLVARFDFTASGSTEVSLYVDPTPGVAPTGPPQAQEDYTSGFVFNQIRFQSGSDGTAAYNFDEFRMGGTYSDVTPSAAGISVSGAVSLQGVQAGNRAQPLTFTLTPTGSAAGSVITQTLTPAASDGAFTLSGVPAGTYTLGVKGRKWLQRDIAIDTTGGSVTGLSVPLLGGDVSGHNQVSLADLAALRAAYGSHGPSASGPASPGWNPQADLTCDGQVSLADLAILRANYGKAGDK